MAGEGPFGRRAFPGLGEKDGEERAPPQADWRLYGITEDISRRRERGGGRRELTG